MADANGLRWRILGPFEVRDGEQPIDVGARKERALLALLLVHRGRSVPVDTVIEELWDERPSATAHKTVHVYVSRLRKTLGPSVIVTEGSAYRMDVDPGAIDAFRFEAAALEGKQLLAAGDARVARARLDEALNLWRGSALADIDAGFATLEAARLQEIRVDAIEDRADADLALGRHRRLVPELQRLVREEPLRERPRAQLMLALYRSGRQVDALAVYRDGRQTLVDELGLEPGPALRDLERRILAHDPGLLAMPEPLPTPPRSRRRRWLAAAAGTAVAAAFVWMTITSGEDPAPAASPNALAVIDPKAGEIVARVPVAADPVGVAVGEDAAWVASSRDEVLQQIDATARRVVRTIGLGSAPSVIGTGPGVVWVASGADGSVTRVDAATGTVADTVRIRPRFTPDFYLRPTPSTLAAGTRSVWTNRDLATVSRLEPGGGRPRLGQLGPGRSADSLTLGFGSLWVTSGEDGALYRLDPEQLTVRGSVRLPDKGAAVVIAGAEAVWVGMRETGRIVRVDPRSLRATHGGSVPGLTALAAGEGALWSLSGSPATVTKLDPRSGRAVQTVPVGGRATGLAAGAGAVWVTTTATEAGPPPAGRVHPVQAIACRDIYFGGSGAPSRLLVLDIPLHWADTPGVAISMRREVAAVKGTLRRHAFRAGRFSVGLQVCDNSTERDGYWTENRCVANARAYAETPALAGIIGPVHSGCARAQLPVLAGAPGGPTPQVGYVTTYLGLTRPGPGTAPGEPDVIAEGDRRAFVRVSGPDDAQGVALAQLARELGARRVFVLDDSTSSGITAARAATAALDVLGLESQSAVWRLRSKSYQRLAERIRRSGADAVILSGCICANSGRLLRDLRAGLPARTRFLSIDAFGGYVGPVGASAPRYVRYLREEAGSAATGLYTTYAGTMPEHLDAEGRERMRRLGSMPPPETGYAGQVVLAVQATEVLLQAIARSDGSRPDLRQQLHEGTFETIAGAVTFDARGDVTTPRFTAYRIDRDRVTALPITVDPDLLTAARRTIGSL